MEARAQNIHFRWRVQVLEAIFQPLYKPREKPGQSDQFVGIRKRTRTTHLSSVRDVTLTSFGAKTSTPG